MTIQFFCSHSLAAPTRLKKAQLRRRAKCLQGSGQMSPTMSHHRERCANCQENSDRTSTLEWTPLASSSLVIASSVLIRRCMCQYVTFVTAKSCDGWGSGPHHKAFVNLLVPSSGVFRVLPIKD